MNKILLIASIGSPDAIPNGVNIKNKQLKNYLLNQNNKELTVVDTENWKKELFSIFFKVLLFSFTSNRIILSINTNSANKLIRFFYITRQQSKLDYFVIGGGLPMQIKQKKYNKKHYKEISKICVETKQMKVRMEKLGLFNTQHVPNFKYMRNMEIYEESKYSNNESIIMKAYYLGRIHPDKGIDMIFKALENINRYEEKIKVDFYGPIDSFYKDEFIEKINNTGTANYNGSIDLIGNYNNYEELSKYDVFLFPTFWEGEGFPGVIIDSFIAGVPIIASDWRYNTELIEDMSTGLIFQTRDLNDFINKIEQLLENKQLLKNLSLNAKEEAVNYSTDVVLSKII